MFRNREVLLMTVIMVLLSAVGIVAGYSRNAVGIIAVISTVFVLLFLSFTCWRYRELDRLAEYLTQVVEDNYDLDIRNNTEGELSILKSEIYKVTVMLREQAVALQKEKGNLADALSDISHQLKTPLTSMCVMTDLLSGDLPQDKRVEFTDKLRRQLERIQWLVSSLLKLSRLDAGTVEFRKTTVPAGELVSAACEPLLIPMDLKDQRLIVDCPEFEFNCDWNWTVEALVNIVKNCVEHAPAGGEIRIKCLDYPLYTEIAVEDTGKGIDKGDLPYIFNRFYKGKNAGKDSVGIGLAMAKSIVTAQGGSINVRSSSLGSKFILRFIR